MDRLKLGVLISGRGSNMAALVQACKAESFPAEVAIVISNKPDAPGLDFAAADKIPTATIDHAKFSSKQSFEEEIDRALRAQGVELVCLAGFMRLLSPWFIARWESRLINIHPSLLPAFKGLHPQKQALDAGAAVSGCTVHFVTADMDAGPILLQAEVPVHPGDTEESLSARILEAEHRLYPEAVRRLATQDFRIVENRVCDWSEKIAEKKSAGYPRS